jgi:hypothetical protein
MDLRLTLALGLAGGLAVTATPALAKADKSPRTRLDAQTPSETSSIPVQAWPQMEDFAPPKYDNDAILDGGVGDQVRRAGRSSDR